MKVITYGVFGSNTDSSCIPSVVIIAKDRAVADERYKQIMRAWLEGVRPSWILDLTRRGIVAENLDWLSSEDVVEREVGDSDVCVVEARSYYDCNLAFVE